MADYRTRSVALEDHYRAARLILPVKDLYQRLIERIEEDVDADDINEHLLYTAGYSIHHLLSWWIEHALYEVLALPISPLNRVPLEEVFAQYLKRTLGEFETDILSYATIIRRVRTDWVDVTVHLNPYRLTLEII